VCCYVYGFFFKPVVLPVSEKEDEKQEKSRF
jgi:hypothetical protein